MPLRLSLKPHERVYIGQAMIVNGATRAELLILNRVPIVRSKDIITEDEADTISKLLYHTILKMYLYPAHERRFHELYFPLLKKLIEMPLESEAIDVMVEVSKKIIAGDHYRALKLCRRLIELEEEYSKDEHGKDQGL